MTTTNKQDNNSLVPMQDGTMIIDREIRAHDALSNWLVADDYDTLKFQLAFNRRKTVAPLIKIREPLGSASAEIYARIDNPADTSSPEINEARATLAALNEKFFRDCEWVLNGWTPTPAQLARWH